MSHIYHIFKKQSIFLLLTAFLAAHQFGLAQPVFQTGGTNLVETSGTTSSATGTSTFTVNRPTGVANGNLMVLYLTQQMANTTANTSSFTPPSGWILIGAVNRPSSETPSMAVYYKIASSEPTSYTVTVQNHGTAARWKATISRITGHDPVTPIMSYNFGNGVVTSTSVAIPSVPATQNALIVAVRSVRRATGTTNNVPSAMTLRWLANGVGTSNDNTNAPSFQGASQSLSSTEFSSGAKTFSWSGTSPGQSVGLMFAVNPAVTPPAATTPTVITQLPCWSRISQRFWVPAKNTTGGVVSQGDIVRVALVINLNNAGGAAGSNTFPGECATTGTQSLHSFSYNQNIPTGTTYQSNSLAGRNNRDLIYPGGNTNNVANLTGNFTDANDALDQAFFSSGSVNFNLGTGATNTLGGVISSQSVPGRGGELIYQITYDVLVTAADFTTINLGGGKLRFRNTSASNTLYEYTVPDMIVRVFPNIPASGLPVDTPNFITAASSGTFGRTFTAKYGDPPGVTGPGFTFIRRSQVNDNEYTVLAQTTRDPRTTPPPLTSPVATPNLKANPVNGVDDVVNYIAASGTIIEGGWDVISDHTNATNTALGNPLFDAPALAQGKGYMLLVNGSYAPEVIFSDKSEGLTANTYYRVTFWIRNVCNNCHNPSGVTPVPSGDESRSNPGILPNVAIRLNGQIVYVSGAIEYDNPTGAFDNTMSRNSWKKKEFVLLNTVGVSEVDFEIINFAPGGGGNDFVIDDIEIKRVLPDITYDQRCLETNFSGTLEGTVNSTAIPSTFDWYQWQQSNDGGDTWIALSAPAQAVAPLDPNNYTVVLSIPAPGAALGTKFRLIAATTEANLANAALIAGLAVVTVDDCCVTYRTSASNTGVWNLNTNWEIFDPAGSAVTFAVAPTPPVAGSRVEIRTPTVMNVDFTVQQCPLVLNDNTTSSLVIDAQRTLRFGGGEDGNAYFNSRPVTVRSNATGTGAIGQMDTDTRTFGDDNVTLERFIPGSKRRWNLLTFGVTNPTATIRDAWVGNALPISGSKNFNDGWPRGTPPPGMVTPMPAPPVSAPPVPGPPPNSFLNKPANVPFPAPGDYVAGNGTIITGHAHTSATSANPQGFDWWQELIIPANTPTWIYRENLGDYVTRRSTTVVPTPSSIRPYRAGEASVWPPNRGTSWLSSEATINTNYLGLGKSIVNATLNEVEQGYMLFTRGDRNVLENWFNATTLRPNGQIRKFGEPTVTVGAPGTLTVVGNPYPSPIDFGEFHGLGSNGSKIERFFYFWDSNLGGTYTHGAWRTVTEASPGTWVAAPSTVGNRPELISSSSAFMVQTSTSGSGNLDFAENIKANIANVNVLPFEVGVGLGSGVFNIDFGRMDADNKLEVMDGAAIIFGNFSTATTDKNDVGKIYGIVSSNEHISIKRDDKIFSFEAYPYPDTEARFPLEILNLNANTKYGFNLIANGIPQRYEAFVVDHHLKEEQKIDFVGSGFEFAFETKADSASFNPDRFEIVFKSSGVLPVVLTDVQAIETNKDVLVTWNTSTEADMDYYTVEHSRNGTEFSKGYKVSALNTSPAKYEWLHKNPGIGVHFYRIRATDLDGKHLLSRVVKVNIGSQNTELIVYPTVLQTNSVSLQMNAMKAGDYNIQVTDMAGRVIQARKMVIANGSATMLMELPATLSAGKYNVIVTGPEGKFVKPFMKQ